MGILDEILAKKRADLAKLQAETPQERLVPLAQAAPPARDFAAALQRPKNGPVRLLAEIKGASPSEGQIRADFDPAAIAGLFEKTGAAAVSVLTEEHFFAGKNEHLSAVKSAVELPVLRKDFTVSEYHIWEARALHADAVLLMAQVLGEREISDLLELTHELSMTALCEAHSEEELDKVLACGARVIGINNRDFDTMTTDLATTERLRERVPEDRVLVSQSGVRSGDDVKRLAAVGVDAVQVGTSIMQQGDIAGFLQELLAGD